MDERQPSGSPVIQSRIFGHYPGPPLPAHGRQYKTLVDDAYELPLTVYPYASAPRSTATCASSLPQTPNYPILISRTDASQLLHTDTQRTCARAFSTSSYAHTARLSAHPPVPAISSRPATTRLHDDSLPLSQRATPDDGGWPRISQHAPDTPESACTPLTTPLDVVLPNTPSAVSISSNSSAAHSRSSLPALVAPDDKIHTTNGDVVRRRTRLRTACEAWSVHDCFWPSAPRRAFVYSSRVEDFTDNPSPCVPSADSAKSNAARGHHHVSITFV